MKTINPLLLGLTATLPFTSGKDQAVPVEPPQDGPNVAVQQVVDTFKWQNPFTAGSTHPGGLEARCEATATFRASQHALRDLQLEPPTGLAPWAEALKLFFGGRPFPGSWEGIDKHQGNRDVIMMEYGDVPAAVKDWVEGAQGDGEGDGRFLFGVYDKPRAAGDRVGRPASARTTPAADDQGDGKVMFFAAGAIYDVLPLWVARGSGCEGEMKSLVGTLGILHG